MAEKKQNKSNYKWAKVFGWEIEELKSQLIKVRLATIIDCEGCIGIYKNGNNYIPVVQADQETKWYVEQFKHVFGFGNLFERKDRRHAGDIDWRYGAECIQALIISLILRDELQLKKDKAMEIIEYYRNKLINNDPNYEKRKNKLLKDIQHYDVNFDFKNGEFILPDHFKFLHWERKIYKSKYSP